ncbi:flavin reductase family protein [Methanococcoides sp. AM1]|uniref:flavin reductase family protein n=1 Tax=Methanococcoides sp. AM1 TaxID=1201011 RepID=UPI0010837436|nr:flavin reductase family protein [Methanococcoides sp. AM1]
MKIAPRKREQIFTLPVALISTTSKNGVLNLAPWSNITPILRPLEEIVLASWIKRDTLNNIREMKEFVINIPSVDMSDEVMICSKNYPADIDEFKEAGLTTKASSSIETPGVNGCLAWAECTFVEEILRDKFSLIIGKVVNLEVNENFFNQNGEMDIEKAKPMSCMLGRNGLEFTYPVSNGKTANYSEMRIK